MKLGHVIPILAATADLDVDEAVRALRDALTLIRRCRSRRRGGDHAARQRRDRDAALKDLARIVGTGMPAERQAREIAERLRRYRPAAAEVSPDRRLMRRIVDIGIRVPSPDRIKRILKSG